MAGFEVRSPRVLPCVRPNDRRCHPVIEECLVVEVGVTGDGCPLATAAGTAETTVEAEPPSLRRDGNALVRFAAPPDETLAATLDADDRVRYLHRARGDDRESYRCLSLEPCVIHDLVDVGFMPESVAYRPEGARFAGAVVGREVLQGVMSAAGDRVGVSLERVYPLGSDSGGAAGRWDLTPAQEEALRTAHAMDYFAVPKAVTAEAVAAELGIGKTAFLERLRRGQAALFEQLFG